MESWSVGVLKTPMLHHSITPFGITLIRRRQQIAARYQDLWGYCRSSLTGLRNPRPRHRWQAGLPRPKRRTGGEIVETHSWPNQIQVPTGRPKIAQRFIAG